MYIAGVEARYAIVSEWIDRQTGKWWALLAYLTWCAVMPLINIDVSNYGISVFTGFMLMVGVAGLRRNWKAMHSKADAIVCATPGADDQLQHIEDRLEDEIDAARS